MYRHKSLYNEESYEVAFSFYQTRKWIYDKIKRTLRISKMEIEHSVQIFYV